MVFQKVFIFAYGNWVIKKLDEKKKKINWIGKCYLTLSLYKKNLAIFIIAKSDVDNQSNNCHKPLLSDINVIS